MDALMNPVNSEFDFATPPVDDMEGRERFLRAYGEAVGRKLGIYRVPDDFTLSVVIPVYNEVNTLGEILRQVRAVPP